jgi:hypothetical protein
VGVSVQPNFLYPRGAIFLCPERVKAIESRHPGAARFFLVHEYGHLFLQTRDEAAADQWAARQLAAVPSERVTLLAVLLHFVEEDERFDPAYGSGMDRALRIAEAARLPEREWPRPLVPYAKAKRDQSDSGTKLGLEAGQGYANAAQMLIYLDRKPVGFLSNVDEKKTLLLPSVGPGRHLLEAKEIWIFHVEEGGQKSEVARKLSAETEFEPHGKRPILRFRFDGESVAVSVVQGGDRR